MKFTHKLILAVIVLLAVILAAAGYLTVTGNFRVAMNSAIAQNQMQHSLERYALEQELAAIEARFELESADTLARQVQALSEYLGEEAHRQAIYLNGAEVLYSTLPQYLQNEALTAALAASSPGYFIHQNGEARTVVFVSRLNSSAAAYQLVSAYDVTPVFVERQRQLWFTLRINGIILLVALAAVAGISVRLTRPIRKLNAASRRIASGAYEARIHVSTNDEIGALGRNFNQMAAAVEAQIEQLHLSVRQREDFVAAFTHEVKTPMTAIIGYSDLLRFQETDSETRQMAAQFIYREAARLEALSQKLLLLMGLSREAANIRPVPVDGLFRDAGQSLAPALKKSEIKLDILPAQGIKVMADRDLAVDLLRNLILNAITARPRDGVVKLRWQMRESRVVLSVEDSGEGIPEKELGRITEPFYMVDKSRARRQGGSGVGLALCRRICELHGCELELKSKAGEGTVVSFALRAEDGRR